MQALKIVCEHYDTMIIDQAKLDIDQSKLDNNYINKLNEKLNFMIVEFEKIQWVSQRPYNSEENFYDIYKEDNNISHDKKKELWNLCEHICEKYKVLFKLFEDENCGCCHYNTFLGVIGGVRALNKLNYACNITNLDENTDYWKHILNDAEKNSYDPAMIAQDKLIDGTINDIFKLNLY
jgi:hypothetical protein|tara:strand:+ start:379 stop:915 length:537 start_codon:yes stop_codon:yes gene_type:complete